MRVLDQLEPRAVFHFFEDLCAIPHGSRNTKAVSDYCVAFARERGLQVRQDGLNNVVIVKEAAPGYEQAGTVILQGHLDMVCEKTPECPLDLERDGLDLAVEGDEVLARGTTLGGDDGIAVAMALAVLDAKDLPHPRLEAVFTVDEEIGMPGALALDASDLQGRALLNIDSEEEGVLTVSCAGGVTAVCRLGVARERAEGRRWTVTVSGGLGGHSGMEIGRGRTNSNQLMGQLLDALSRRTELRLISVNGGLKDNAIPRETTAELLVPAGDSSPAAVAEELNAAWRKAYAVTDPGVTVQAAPQGPAQAEALTAEAASRVICLLHTAPSGVQEMSADIPGLVQTSLNLGILATAEDAVSASFSVRSSLSSQKDLLVSRLTRLTEQLGGAVALEGAYPAWEFRRESPLVALMTEVFREQYGRDPKVEAIHAGLECGVFSDKLPGLDCVSFGPDLKNVHTPRERMSVSSVQRVWAFLLEVLRRFG